MNRTHVPGKRDGPLRVSPVSHQKDRTPSGNPIAGLLYGTETNVLLMPQQDCDPEALPADLERIDVRAGQVVCDRGEPCEHAYFPLSACFCYRCVLSSGASLELARIGCEGFAGWPAMTGGAFMPFRTEAVSDGSSLRCSAQALQESLAVSPAFQQRVMRHFQAVSDEIARTAACTRFHTVNQRICRWLLTESDRTSNNELDITLTALADALGVSSRAVSAAVHQLQQCGALECTRGVLRLLDRGTLKAGACECYRPLQPPAGDDGD
jgi:CRP-like cAMP-binding protein